VITLVILVYYFAKCDQATTLSVSVYYFVCFFTSI